MKHSPFVLVPQYFGSTVFDRSTSRYLPFDRETTELLVRLKREPFDFVLAQTEDAARRSQLVRFFEAFYKLGFFTIDFRFAGSILDVEVPPDHLVGPLALHLEIVAACNLRCTHCFAGELPRKEEPLSLRELDELFATLARIGTFRIGLTGGEPLLRRDVFDVIDLATEHGLHPCITTNGLLITEEIAREFGKRKLVWLNVSLEGATAETNDPVRGKGTFDLVRERLSLLSQHARFTLAFTIMKSNLEEMKACVELAYQVGAHTAVFRPLYPVGIARHHLELMPSFVEYNDALNVLAGAQQDKEFELCSIDPFSPHTREETQASIYDNYGCGAGNLVCSVSLSGDVNPCSFLGPEFAAANIRSTPFEEIWHNSNGFRSIRGLPGGDEESFSGGCRARALVLNGSINAADPWIDGYREQQKLATSKRVYQPLTVLNVTRA
ncbi:MAG TPA: radical SAM protein [Pyrinomonadaceae bacterium]|nr:radical SAM protein [Pyrinomonadaceae bacterium]